LSRILNEITLILDTLLRLNHLSVETVHPLLSFQMRNSCDGTPLPAQRQNCGALTRMHDFAEIGGEFP